MSHIEEQAKLLQEVYGCRLLEALEQCKVDMQECPELVPWEVRTAYTTLVAGFREMFFGSAKEVDHDC